MGELTMKAILGVLLACAILLTGCGPEDDSADISNTPTAIDTAEPVTPPEPEPRTYLVVRVVDGDTVNLGNGESARLVGIDTPEQGECGYDAATANLVRLVQGKRVTLGESDEDRDRYGRLLRYVDIGKVDSGLRQIEAGYAIARYDSRDGYGAHSRERQYIRADRNSPSKTGCPKPSPAPPAPSNCAAGYSPCIPPYPPDLDCADVNGPIYVTGSDPHGLDADNDGVACES